MTLIHTHTHTIFSQGQLTVVHLFWTDVLSSPTAQVSVLSLAWQQPRLHSSSSAGSRVFIQSTVGSHDLLFLTMQCRVSSPSDPHQETLAVWSFPPPPPKCSETAMSVTIMSIVLMPLFGGRHSSPRVYTVARPLTEVK